MLGRVSRQMPILKIETQNADMQVQTRLHETKLSVKQGSFDVRMTLPSIRLDATEAWTDIGQKGIAGLARDIAQDAQTKGLRCIGKVASEGDKLARDIRPKAAALFEVIKARQRKNIDYNVDAIPKHMVEVEVFEGYVEGVYTPYEIEVHVPRRSVEMQYSPGEVEIELGYVDTKL